MMNNLTLETIQDKLILGRHGHGILAMAAILGTFITPIFLIDTLGEEASAIATSGFALTVLGAMLGGGAQIENASKFNRELGFTISHVSIGLAALLFFMVLGTDSPDAFKGVTSTVGSGLLLLSFGWPKDLRGPSSNYSALTPQ